MKLAILFGAVAVAGCAIPRAVGRHEGLPPAAYLDVHPNPTAHIDVFRKGDRPKKPIIQTAHLVADGNAYATAAVLENTLIEEARMVGADGIIITESRVTNDETIGTYGYGVISTETIQRPHLYATAFNYSKVRCGVRGDKEGFVTYVTEGSPAASAGIVEGDRILAINGEPYVSSPYVMDTEISTKRPGDAVVIEILDKTGTKQRKTLILTAP